VPENVTNAAVAVEAMGFVSRGDSSAGNSLFLDLVVGRVMRLVGSGWNKDCGSPVGGEKTGVPGPTLGACPAKPPATSVVKPKGSITT